MSSPASINIFSLITTTTIKIQNFSITYQYILLFPFTNYSSALACDNH